jgi:uncharacterized protein
MSAGPALPFSLDGDGVRLAVRLTPRAKRDELAGLVDSGDGRVAIAVRLAARPTEGAANRALVDFLARALDVPRSTIRIVAGEKSRLKTVFIECADATTLACLL